MTDRIRQNGFAILRIIFGIIWLIDAFFKWNPQFMHNFVSYFIVGALGQPPIIHAWIEFCISIININPPFFAVAVALAEMALALSLLSGFLSKYAMYGGILVSLGIWTTAEGFGGPYAPGSTDIGSAIIYALVFIALIMGNADKRLNIKNIFYHQSDGPA